MNYSSYRRSSLAAVFIIAACTGPALADVNSDTLNGLTNSPGSSSVAKKPLCSPVFSVSPSFGQAETPVKITSRCPTLPGLANNLAPPATSASASNTAPTPLPPKRPGPCLVSKCPPTIVSVTFGATPATWVTANSDGSITAAAPYPEIPGASVPVAVTLSDGTIIGGGAVTFSYPIASMFVEGPLYYNVQGAADTWWNNQPYSIEANIAPTLTFGVVPTFHVGVAFGVTAYAEGTFDQQNDEVLGNVGQYAAFLQVCKLGANKGAQQDAFGHVMEDTCANWDGNSGLWATVSQQQATLNAGQDPEDLALKASPAFDLSVFDLEHTFRLQLCRRSETAVTLTSEETSKNRYSDARR